MIYSKTYLKKVINLHSTNLKSLEKKNPIHHHAATWNILNFKTANFPKTQECLFSFKDNPPHPEVDFNAPSSVLYHGYQGNTDWVLHPMNLECISHCVGTSLSDMHENRLTFCPWLEAASSHCLSSPLFLWEKANSPHLSVSWQRCYLSPGCQHWTSQHAHHIRGKDEFLVHAVLQNTSRSMNNWSSSWIELAKTFKRKSL